MEYQGVDIALGSTTEPHQPRIQECSRDDDGSQLFLFTPTSRLIKSNFVQHEDTYTQTKGKDREFRSCPSWKQAESGNANFQR